MTQPNRAADAAADDDVRPDDIQPEAESPSPDTILIEHEGQTYELPAALKGAVMRQADYTRKTQALALQRAALAEAGKAVDAHAQALSDHGAELGRVVALQDQVDRLSGLNWPALQQQNPAQAQALMHQMFQLKQAHEIAVGALRHRQAVKAFEARRDHAARVEHSHRVLSREIEGWSPEHAGRLAQYALGQGIAEHELMALSDPRLVKVLHHACLHHEDEQKKAAGQRLAKAQAIRPAIEVGGSGSGPTDPNRMSTADWMKHRRGQLRSKAHNR